VWKQYSSPCGPTAGANNIADEIKPDGSHAGYWDGVPVDQQVRDFNVSDDVPLNVNFWLLPEPKIPSRVSQRRLFIVFE
jgi:hypothetical protein